MESTNTQITWPSKLKKGAKSKKGKYERFVESDAVFSEVCRLN